MNTHKPTIAEYDWTIGTRCRWDCSCGRGKGAYTNLEAAVAGFERHVEARAMWEQFEGQAKA